MKFAKLFDLPNGYQVLYTQEIDDDEEKYEMAIRSDGEGVSASIKLRFNNEDEVNVAYDGLTTESAQKSFDNVLA